MVLMETAAESGKQDQNRGSNRFILGVDSKCCRETEQPKPTHGVNISGGNRDRLPFSSHNKQDRQSYPVDNLIYTHTIIINYCLYESGDHIPCCEVIQAPGASYRST